MLKLNFVMVLFDVSVLVKIFTQKISAPRLRFEKKYKSPSFTLTNVSFIETMQVFFCYCQYLLRSFTGWRGIQQSTHLQKYQEKQVSIYTGHVDPFSKIAGPQFLRLFTLFRLAPAFYTIRFYGSEFLNCTPIIMKKCISN